MKFNWNDTKAIDELNNMYGPGLIPDELKTPKDILKNMAANIGGRVPIHGCILAQFILRLVEIEDEKEETREIFRQAKLREDLKAQNSFQKRSSSDIHELPDA